MKKVKVKINTSNANSMRRLIQGRADERVRSIMWSDLSPLLFEPSWLNLQTNRKEKKNY